MIQFPPMRWVTTTLHPSAAAPAPLSDFKTCCGPPVYKFDQPWTTWCDNESNQSAAMTHSDCQKSFSLAAPIILRDSTSQVKERNARSDSCGCVSVSDTSENWFLSQVIKTTLKAHHCENNTGQFVRFMSHIDLTPQIIYKAETSQKHC